jgi:hypothetical protein
MGAVNHFRRSTHDERATVGSWSEEPGVGSSSVSAKDVSLNFQPSGGDGDDTEPTTGSMPAEKNFPLTTYIHCCSQVSPLTTYTWANLAA